MNSVELKKYIAREGVSLIDAMKMIDDNAKGIIYITDMDNRLIGSLTDGDIRRWILNKADLTGHVEQIMYKNTKYLTDDDRNAYIEYMRREGLRSLPIVDKQHRIIDICFQYDVKETNIEVRKDILKNVPVIIMAGGKGTRLYPYTRILPKPLIPIGDVPILERILNRFYNYGVDDFYISVNYKKEVIKSYFSEQKTKYVIHYIEEEQPLGTAGSITLINKKFTTPVIITNCDTLIEAEYDKLLQHHRDSGNDMTIVSSLKNTNIPYGVLHLKEHGIITSMEEKPQLSYFINTGMYVVNPEFLEWIPSETVYHMTNLADKMLEMKKKVGMYPISENSFLDMGEFEEMKKMESRMNSGMVN